MKNLFLFALILGLFQVSVAEAGGKKIPQVIIRARGDRPVRPANLDAPPVKTITAEDLKMPDPDTKKLLETLPELNVQQTPAANQRPQQSICKQETEAAADECNFNNNQEAQAAMLLANQLRQQVKAMTMANREMLCSKMGAASQAMDVAVGAFSTYCSTAHAKCESACNDEIESLNTQIEASSGTAAAALEEALEEAKVQKRACAKLAGNVQNVMENIGGYAQMEAAKAQACQDKTDVLAEMCKSQPGNPMCKTNGSANCADPNVAATSTVCICQRSPNDPRCGSGANMGLQSNLGRNGGSNSGASGGTDGTDSAGDFGGMGGADGTGGGGFGDFKGSNGEGPGGSNFKAGMNRGGGGLGGGGLGGGQNGRGGGAGGAGAGASGVNAKIINGYGVGGATGARGYVGSAGGPNGLGAGGRNGYGSGAYGKNGKGVDLSKFLPGGQMDPSRGLAGVSGPDGITGPNTDIWKKINMRYYSVSPSLLP